MRRRVEGGEEEGGRVINREADVTDSLCLRSSNNRLIHSDYHLGVGGCVCALDTHTHTHTLLAVCHGYSLLKCLLNESMSESCRVKC